MVNAFLFSCFLAFLFSCMRAVHALRLRSERLRAFARVCALVVRPAAWFVVEPNGLVHVAADAFEQLHSCALSVVEQLVQDWLDLFK